MTIQHQHSRHRAARGASSGSEVLEVRTLLAAAFRFDYSLDTRGFFDAPGSRAALNLAGDIVSSRLGDTLDAIRPSGGNSWQTRFRHPSTGQETSRSNPTIPADEILVFVGSRNLGGTLAQGGRGGFSASGTTSWLNTISARGESGALRSRPTDTGPWGGTLAFSTTTDWHFGTTVQGLESNESDFVTVAVHELFHVLGVGLTGGSWTTFVNNGRFTGQQAGNHYDGSGSVPLSPQRSHLAAGTTDEGQPAALTPSLARGKRTLPTLLDWALVDDIGWDVNRQTHDFGDAPAAQYPTLRADNGARHHVGGGLFLGIYADADANGQSDDSADEFHDDRGVSLPGFVSAGDTARVQVTANRSGFVDAWIDFNRDGDWADPGEQIVDSVPVDGGRTSLDFAVPDNVRPGETWARFRLSSTGNLSPTGNAADGEVEDHPVLLIDGVLAENDSFFVASGSAANLDVLANDLPADQAEVIGFTQPTRGTVTANPNGTLRYQSSGGSGDTFRYTIARREEKLNRNRAANDEFGTAIAAFNDLVVVGAPLDDTARGVDAGSVTVYRRNGSDWQLVQSLTAPDGNEGDRFGYSVDVDQTTLVVGARGDDDLGLNAGSAYVYELEEDGRFSLSGRLFDPTGRRKDQFGHSVAIDQDTIVVGARSDDGLGTNSGSAFVFTRSAESWDFETRIKPETLAKGDRFGTSVAVLGNRIAVGARQANSPGRINSGAVYLLERQAGQWQVVRHIVSPVVKKYGYFGHAVALHGNQLLVGQPERDREVRSGRAFLFDRDEGGRNAWGRVRTFTPVAPSGGNQFGYSVAFVGNDILIGSPLQDGAANETGTVSAYGRNVGGNSRWGLRRRLTADDAAGRDEYGRAVALTAGDALIGSPNDDDDGRNSGSVYVQDLRSDTADVTISAASGASAFFGRAASGTDLFSEDEEDRLSGLST